MKAIFLLLIVVIFAISCRAQAYPCLGSDVKANEIASVSTTTSRSGKIKAQKLTVKTTLDKLRARCVRGKLIDRRGREIRFYRLDGCWGNPPADYLEILERQRKEIEELKKRYTVVEMTCNPGGIPSPQSIV